MENTVVQQNQARLGGGIFVEGGEFEAINCNISSNQADEDGGGLMVDGGRATLANRTLVVANFAARRGDQIFPKGGELLCECRQLVSLNQQCVSRSLRILLSHATDRLPAPDGHWLPAAVCKVNRESCGAEAAVQCCENDRDLCATMPDPGSDILSPPTETRVLSPLPDNLRDGGSERVLSVLHGDQSRRACPSLVGTPMNIMGYVDGDTKFLGYFTLTSAEYLNGTFNFNYVTPNETCSKINMQQSIAVGTQLSIQAVTAPSLPPAPAPPPFSPPPFPPSNPPSPPHTQSPRDSHPNLPPAEPPQTSCATELTYTTMQQDYNYISQPVYCTRRLDQQPCGWPGNPQLLGKYIYTMPFEAVDDAFPYSCAPGILGSTESRYQVAAPRPCPSQSFDINFSQVYRSAQRRLPLPVCSYPPHARNCAQPARSARPVRRLPQ